ncbi:MAG: hypothetical protein WD009_10775 [Phycisphaeraceae bacterium]
MAQQRSSDGHAQPWRRRSNVRRRVSGTLAAALAIATLAGPATADEHLYRWINPDGGLYQDAANWDQDEYPPYGAELVVFDLDATYAVDFDAHAVTEAATRVLAGDVTFGSPGTIYWASGGEGEPTLTVARDVGDDATLRLTNGQELRLNTFTGGASRVGDAAGSVGTIVASGEGTRLGMGGNLLHVGYAGTGTLSIDDLAQVGDNSGGEVSLGTTATGNGTVVVRNSGWDASDPFGDPIGGLNVSHLTVGAAGSGSVTVEHGGYASAHLVARDAGSYGELTVRGTDDDGNPSHLRLEGAPIGLRGHGSVVAEAGATLRTYAHFTDDSISIGGDVGSEGSIVVRGEGTSWEAGGHHHVGFAEYADVAYRGGSGSVAVEDGAVVTQFLSGSYWRLGGDGGKLTIRDPSSSMAMRELQIGSGWGDQLDGAGELVVEAGGELRSGIAVMGLTAGSHGQAVVRGAGSTWVVDDDQTSHPGGGSLYVGRHQGTGDLLIEDGGRVEARVSYVSLGAAGNVTVRDAGSVWIHEEELGIGGATSPGGPGTVNVEDDARLHAGPRLHVWDQGVLNVTTGGAAAVGSLGDEQALDALAGDTLHVWADGTASGAGAINAAMLVNSGRVAPGIPRGEDDPPTPGTLSLDGEYEQSADGVLDVAITEAGHGQLAVTGTASLAGQLAVDVVGGGSGMLWQPVNVLAADAVTGTFDDVMAPERDDLFLTVAYGAQHVTVTPGLFGDMNSDGVLDAVDVAPFVLALTNPQAYATQYGIEPDVVGDVNRDEAIDALDVAPFVGLLVAGGGGGGGDGGGGGALSVPEPGGAALLAGLGGVLLRRGRRGRALVSRPGRSLTRRRRRRASTAGSAGRGRRGGRAPAATTRRSAAGGVRPADGTWCPAPRRR